MLDLPQVARTGSCLDRPLPPLRKPYKPQVVKAPLFQNVAFVMWMDLTLKLAFWNKGRHYKVKSNPLTRPLRPSEFLALHPLP